MNNEDDVMIRLEAVNKTFKLPHEKYTSVKSIFVNFYHRRKGYEMQQALKDVSFNIKKGEFFGIIGRNGSGKSTLLKLLAGIYTPTSGSIQVNGSLTPFIELGVGFNPELTGRENVFLNGALLGFNRKEMQKMYQDIVDFSELEKFMDQKLKNYSSGMQVRLAFSIAIRAQSDILLIDEVLAVGDTAFQRKCSAVFERLKKEGRTIVFVSHDMESVKHFCTRAAIITNGVVDFIGNPEQVADIYIRQNADKSKLFQDKNIVNAGAKITELVVEGSKKKEFRLKDVITLSIKTEVKKSIKAFVGINILKEDGQLVAGLTTQFQIKPQLLTPDKKTDYTFSFKSDQLTEGNFWVDGAIYSAENGRPIFFRTALASFKIKGTERGWGAFNIIGDWEVYTQK